MPDSECQELFQACLDSISSRYKPGTVARLKSNPVTWARVLQMERNLDLLWEMGNFSGFKTVCVQYERLVLGKEDEAEKQVKKLFAFYENALREITNSIKRI